MVNDFTLARMESTTSLPAYDDDLNRSRSISPVLGHSIGLIGRQSRSPEVSQSLDFERQGRSLSSERYFSNDYNNYTGYDGKIISSLNC